MGSVVDVGGHFSVDVDVEALRRARRQLADVATHLDERGRHLRGAPDRWGSDWTGKASRHMAAQARDLAADARAFSRDFTSAADAVKVFASAAADAVDVTVPDLNRRWREAAAVYDEAVNAAGRRRDRALGDLPEDTTPEDRSQTRLDLEEARRLAVRSAVTAHSAAQAQLEGEYDDLVRDLRRAASRLGDELQRAVAMAVPIEQAAAFTFRAIQRHPAGELPTDAAWAKLRARATDRFGGPAHELLDDLATPSTDLDEVISLLAQARELGLRPGEYRETLEQFWFLSAAAEAGIDVDQWRPELGAKFNEATIMAVYRYYGDLYLENSDLQWAGMANMIGPSFAGGFLDLSMLRDLAQIIEKYPPGARPFDREAISALADLGDEDLEFYETTLLSMQKEIFHDQATMHEAYRTGGIDAVKEMYEAGILDRKTYQSWLDIDSGDPERVQAGNEQFLHREQWDVIQDDYQRMYDRPVTGPIVTWGMTQIGSPSIPGAQSYAKIDPLNIGIETPGPEHVFQVPFTDIGWLDNPIQGEVRVDTPLADGNVANFDDRWKLIEEDTLPAYQRLLAEDPELVEALVRADVGDRVDEFRLKSTWDDILRDFLTDWELTGFEQ